MAFIKPTLIALVLTAAGATGAFAEEENASTCLAAAKQVNAALSGASQNADEARTEKQRGMEYCNAGFYHRGMEHYARAMELLGVKG
jgi:hypothetical protein